MNNLEKVLAEYHKYLMFRKLAKAEHAPYLVGWVKEFLQFAKDPSTRYAKRRTWGDAPPLNSV